MKIAIVGTSDSAKEAPFKDDSWQIWSLGRNHVWIPRYDKWFELHTFEQLYKAKTDTIYYDHLVKVGDKLLLSERNINIPKAKVFPKRELIEKYGIYFTSSIAWMLIHAIDQLPEEIGIWGVNMTGDNEYAHQRPCCEYWIGRAVEKGIKVTIHSDSMLLKGRTYCEDSYYQVLNMARSAKDIADKARDDAHYKQGWLDALLHIKRTFG